MTDEPLDIGEMHPPDAGSASALAYYSDKLRTFRLFHFLADSVARGDWVAHSLRKIADGDEYPTIGDFIHGGASKSAPRLNALREWRSELIELFLVRLVDNFQCYMSDIIREVLQHEPRLLSTSQHALSVEYLIASGSIDAVIADLVEQKVQSLTSQGFEDVRQWCMSRGVPISVRTDDEAIIIESIAMRNIIVHNRGVVDQRFVDRVQHSGYSIGDPLSLNSDHYLDSIARFGRLVRDTDAAIVRKYSLDSVSISDAIF